MGRESVRVRRLRQGTQGLSTAFGWRLTPLEMTLLRSVEIGVLRSECSDNSAAYFCFDATTATPYTGSVRDCFSPPSRTSVMVCGKVMF